MSLVAGSSGESAADLLPKSDGRVTIRINSGPHQGEERAFDSPGVTIVGRAADAHWQVAKDPSFSRYHFRLEANPPNCSVSDLNSSNGTLVNGDRIQQRNLQDGDRIECGDTVFFVAVEGRKNDAAIATLDLPPEEKGLTAAKLGARPEPLLRVVDYDLMEVIGKGGMGIVYKAVQRTTNREVAVKLIKSLAPITDRSAKYFFREVTILLELQHARIVEYFDAGIFEQHLYLVMELLPTIDWQSLLFQQTPPIRVQRSCAIVCRVLEGLAHAHAMGIVHRDIKPGNVLVYKRGKSHGVKLADFGLAKKFGSAGFSAITPPGTLGLGTLGFASRDQLIDGCFAKPPSDIYSAGACLYYLLCGKTPYKVTDVGSTIALMLNSDPEPLTNHAPDLPRGLIEIVERAMAIEPGNRFESAQAMRKALRPFAGP